MKRWRILPETDLFPGAFALPPPLPGLFRSGWHAGAGGERAHRSLAGQTEGGGLPLPSHLEGPATRPSELGHQELDPRF